MDIIYLLIYKVQIPYTTGSKADWHSLDARYFVIKSNNMDNVEISMEKVSLVFSTIPGNVQLYISYFLFMTLSISL
jgi:hypothetical protein